MLEIQDLRVRFLSRDREAVAGVSLSIGAGEIVGLVGESGSGKSVTAMSVAGLLPRKQCEYSGSIRLDGEELLHADRERLRRIQGKEIGVVFQEPQSSLNPLMKIGPQVEEVLRVHTDLGRGERRRLAVEAMAAVIAKPKLLLLDEPTTALDVTIQAQILELLKRRNRESGVSMLFISHDLNVVRKLCGRVAVMQKGRLVEEGEAQEVFRHPRHPDTQRLIAAIPTRKRKEAEP